MIASEQTRPAGVAEAAAAFDTLAAGYDERWTRSAIGLLQRSAVWNVLDELFRPGEWVLDLGCGTAADAIHLAHRGVQVHAIDASSGMVQAAASRVRQEGVADRVFVERKAMEEISSLARQNRYDGALSDFGALNCVEELRPLASALSHLLRPGAPVVLCTMGRFCVWETLWYLSRGQPSKAFRRLRGTGSSNDAGAVRASIGSAPPFKVFYPSRREMLAAFGRDFSLISSRGLGIAVPPSCMQTVADSSPRFLEACERIDRVISGWPLIRGLGDHRLLVFVRR